MSKHTPGPWKVINGWNEKGEGRFFPSVVIHEADELYNRIIINVSHDQQQQSLMANARLISKAPEMYDLLSMIRDHRLYGRPLKFEEIDEIDSLLKTIDNEQ